MIKSVLFSAFFLITANACAAEADKISVSVQSETSRIQFKNNDVKPVRFSRAFLNAAETCSAYSENIAETNPDWKKYAGLFGLPSDGAVDVVIKGKDENGQCLFSVKNSLIGLNTISYDCKLSRQQHRELYAAMIDPDTTPVTETFTVYSTMELPDGSTKKIPSEMQMTDSKFNIAWNKLLHTACSEQINDPNEEEINILKEKIFSFSPSFTEKIKQCLPAQETKQIFLLTVTVSVKGFSGDRCQISVLPFELFVKKDELNDLTTLEKIYSFIETADENSLKYIPEYQSAGIISALKACQKGTPRHEGPKMSKSFGNAKIQTGILAAFANGVCQIKLANVLERNNQKKGFGKICTLSSADLKNFVAPDSLNDPDDSFVSLNSPEDKDTLKKIMESNLCR